MRLCKIWQGGMKTAMDMWEVAQRGRHGESLIECKRAGCGWVGPFGVVAECGGCGERQYLRLAETERGA